MDRSQLPNPPPFKKHGQVTVLADLEHGAMEGGGQAGQGSRALDGAAQLEALGSDPQDRAEREQPAVMVGHHRAIQAGDGFQHRGLEIGQVHPPHDMVERSLGVLGREVFGVLGIVGDDFCRQSGRGAR